MKHERKKGIVLLVFVALLVVSASSLQASNMTYHNGRVVNTPHLHVIYWSSDWDAAHSDPMFKRANIDAWLANFMASNYFDKAGQYGSNPGNFSESNGSFFGDPGGTTDSGLIHLWLTGEIEVPGTGVPYPCGDDDMYVVMLPKGTGIDNIFNSTCGSFGAYHLFAPILVPPLVCSVLGGGQLSPYVVIPVDCATHATGANGFYNDFDSLTTLLSHEIIEACTDPLDSFLTSVPVIGDIFSFLSFLGIDPAWYDDTVGNLFTDSEAADKCETSLFNEEVWLNDSIVAAYWSNNDSGPSAGPGIVKTFQLKCTGVPGSFPVPTQFDSRTPNVNAGGGFNIQVATNTNHTYTFPTPVNGNAGTRYVTTEPPGSAFVTTDFSKTATYTTQYFVTVNTNPGAAATGNATLTPSDWYPAGPFTLHTDQFVSAGPGARYSFASWSGGVNTATKDPSETLSAPQTDTANFGLQYFITFDQTGIPAGPPWHVTVQNVQQLGPFSDWFPNGTIIPFSYQTPVPDLTPGTRYVLTGTSVTTPVTADATKTIIGTYKTQHLLTINTTGLGKVFFTHFFNNAVQIGQANDPNPYSDWFDHGTPLALTADPYVMEGSIPYFFQGFTPAPPAALNAPFTTTAPYLTMAQLIANALASGGISPVPKPGPGGLADYLRKEWADVTSDLAMGNYRAALSAITVFTNTLSAESGKRITPALAKTLSLDALMIYHEALCKAKALHQITATQYTADYNNYYKSLTTALGGVVLPPCP